MRVEEIKKLGLYDLPQILGNDQSKKDISYEKYVEIFLKEEPRELESIAEKKALFFLLWGAMYDKKMETDLSYMKEWSILDVRTKDGQLPTTLIENKHCRASVGVDMVKGWVDYAINKKRNVVYCPDLTELPFVDNAFDIVYSYKTFGRVKDNKEFLKELCRVSKKYVFLLIDDIVRDRNIQSATTLDLRLYKKWIIDNGCVELTLVNNPVSGNQNEKLVALYKKCGGIS